MSEIKRVALSTFEPQTVSDKVNKKTCKTVRLSVILPESNEDNCPEYNYKDKLAAVKKRVRQEKESTTENGLDVFGGDDDDVRRIALEMEAKYGTGMKKKRKGRKDDYADIGMGYDETDSFIDNTDGYDEIIPQNVTTLHGGFYINCGALEFKTDDEASSEISSSSSDSEDDDKGAKSSSRKRILDTSDETDSDADKISQTEKKPKLQTPKISMQQAIKKKLFSQNKIQVKKRRPIDPLKKTVKDLLREKREDLNMSIPMDLNHSKELEDNIEKDSLKENKKPMSIISVTDAIESVVKQGNDLNYDNQNKQNIDVNIKMTDLTGTKSDAPSSVEGESSQDGHKTEKVEVKLPENLPDPILELINKIKQAAIDYKGEGKKKFFTDEVNSLLLNLERKCKILGKSSRVKIYDHLAFYIKCRKETISRRAKNLVLEDDERRLKKLTIKLKNCINQIMPSLMMNYEQESQRIIQKKFSKESIDNEENKALKMPRKRFQWSEESRKLIKDILSLKKRCLLLEGKQKDNLEDQISHYLKTDIVPLWPEGWVSLNTLKKVYNNMTENSKMQDNSNSKTNSPKPHSSLTIIPISNSKSQPNKSDVPNDISVTKISNHQSSAKPTEINTTNLQTNSIITSMAPQHMPQSIGNMASIVGEKNKIEREHSFKKYSQTGISKEAERTKHNKEHDYRKYMPISNSERENEKSRYETDHGYKMPVSSKSSISNSSVRENEKINHDKGHEHKKTISKPNVLPSSVIRENEKSKAVKDSRDLSIEASKFKKESNLKAASDSSLIVINTHQEEPQHTVNLSDDKKELSAVIPLPKAAHCQVIDLTDSTEANKIPKSEEERPFNLSKELVGFASSHEIYPDPKKLSVKHPDLTISPSFISTSTPKTISKSDGDDIQMVMENLKALQKLSSPIKADSTGSPVSVIAYNKSFSPKSNNSSQGSTSTAQQIDFTNSFQDEFQKQFISAIQQSSTNSNSSLSSYNKCS